MPEEPSILDEKYHTVHEVAEAFNVEDETVRTWIRQDLMRSIKLGKGGQHRIPESAVREFANRKYGDD